MAERHTDGWSYHVTPAEVADAYGVPVSQVGIDTTAITATNEQRARASAHLRALAETRKAGPLEAVLDANPSNRRAALAAAVELLLERDLGATTDVGAEEAARVVARMHLAAAEVFEAWLTREPPLPTTEVTHHDAYGLCPITSNVEGWQVLCGRVKGHTVDHVGVYPPNGALHTWATS